MSRTLLVIPNYNDTRRLRPFLGDLLRFLPANFSVLVSDDGSGKKEREELKDLIEKSRSLTIGPGPTLLDPIFAPRNTGKGGAVHRGWEHGNGFSLIAFADADGAVSASEIVRAEIFLRFEDSGADAVFASRIKMLGRSIQRSLVRHLTGRVFATLVSIVGGIPTYDTQCGLKIIKWEAYQEIRPYFQTRGFAFDVELCMLLLTMGKKIVEFPIDWHDVSGGKINLFADSIRMAVEVIQIRRRTDSLKSTLKDGIRQHHSRPTVSSAHHVI